MINKIGNMNRTHTFSSTDGLYINFEIILHVVIYWPLMGLCIYMGVLNPNIYIILLSIIACLVLLVSGINLYQRWQLFKIEESTSLSIDVKQRTYIYKHNDIVIDFVSNDIEKWYWHIYHLDPVNTVLAEMVEIRLKSGKKIIVSNAIGPVLDFFRENWKELGIPKGTKTSRSLRSYIKEIKN